VQFHLEVSASIAAEWARVPAYAEALERTRGAGALPRLLAEFDERRPAMEEQARALFARYLDTVVEAGRTARVATGGVRR
jgi:hypothetical protein